MALLSVSALGNCQTNGNPNVTELTREQKEDLKKMYGMYQLFTTTSGIPEDAVAKARTEPLPWVKAEREFDPTPVKDRLSNT